MKSYQKLIKGHQLIKDSLDDLESYQFTDRNLVKAMAVLKSYTLIHLVDEKKLLFPKLNNERLNNPLIAKAMKIIETSKKQANEVLVDFFDRFKSGEMDKAEFERELSKISIIWTNLMKEEEAFLYKFIAPKT